MGLEVFICGKQVQEIKYFKARLIAQRSVAHTGAHRAIYVRSPGESALQSDYLRSFPMERQVNYY